MLDFMYFLGRVLMMATEVVCWVLFGTGIFLVLSCPHWIS